MSRPSLEVFVRIVVDPYTRALSSFCLLDMWSSVAGGSAQYLRFPCDLSWSGEMLVLHLGSKIGRSTTRCLLAEHVLEADRLLVCRIADM